MFLWSLYYSPGVHWVVCVVTVATVLVYWLYSNWQPASQHQGGRTRSHALWFGHNRKLFYWLLRGRRLLCSASWRVSPPWKDCKPAGSPGNISKCKLVYHTQVFKHQVVHVSRMIEPPSWQMSALELLLIHYFCILLVYHCALYHGMLMIPHVHGHCLIPHEPTQCRKITQMPAILCTLNEIALTPTLIAL